MNVLSGCICCVGWHSVFACAGFVSISFDAVAYDVIERDMMVQVCVSLSAAYFESVSVSLIPEAIAGGVCVVCGVCKVCVKYEWCMYAC